jgi:hypothetical protein
VQWWVLQDVVFWNKQSCSWPAVAFVSAVRQCKKIGLCDRADEGTTVFRNVGNHSPSNTIWCPTRLESWAILLRQAPTSHGALLKALTWLSPDHVSVFPRILVKATRCAAWRLALPSSYPFDGLTSPNVVCLCLTQEDFPSRSKCRTRGWCGDSCPLSPDPLAARTVRRTRRTATSTETSRPQAVTRNARFLEPHWWQWFHRKWIVSCEPRQC